MKVCFIVFSNNFGIKFDSIYNYNYNRIMDNNYFPGQGLGQPLFSPEAPSPAPVPDANVVYAELMNERDNREIRKLNDKVKLLEDEIKKLTHENDNLKARTRLENKIENIYQLTPSFETIEEMVNQLADQLKNKI
jgi:hypothetical protein